MKSRIGSYLDDVKYLPAKRTVLRNHPPPPPPEKKPFSQVSKNLMVWKLGGGVFRDWS